MPQGISTKTGRMAGAGEGKCGRPVRRGPRRGLPCTKVYGYGTDHLGEGPCQYHGGKTPRGAASPTFKHGRYSRHWASVGAKMESAISDLASDPDYLHLRRHIATVDALFLQELAAMEDANGGGGWDKARSLTVDMRMAIAGGNVAGIQKALKQLQTLADSGVRRDKSLVRVQSLLRDRANLTRTDQARVESEKAYATVDQLKDIALNSATSIASQLDLFMRQLMTMLSEAERLRIQEPFTRLRRETLQGVSDSFRRALVGHVLPPGTNGGPPAGQDPGPPKDETPASDAVIVVEAVEADPTGTQVPPHPPGPSRAAQAVPIPGFE